VLLACVGPGAVVDPGLVPAGVAGIVTALGATTVNPTVVW
jgi:hypothetical protein